MARSLYAVRTGVAVGALAGSFMAAAGSAQTQQPNSPLELPYMLRVTTREVMVDIVAVDGHDRPVIDLQSADLRIVEKDGQSSNAPLTISSFRFVDPAADEPHSSDSSSNGFRIATNESCLQLNSAHYQLAYHPGPQGLTPGQHKVLIRTTRRGVRLFYRHDYFVGATAPPEKPPAITGAELEKELQVDACSHPIVPLSISLRAFRIATGNSALARYSVLIEPGSLAFVSLSDSGRRLQLDYGACNFNAAGHPINYMSAITDQVLSPVEYARAESHGFHRIFEFAPPPGIAMTRFVVHDRITGNLGLADVTFPIPKGPPLLDPAVLKQLQAELAWNEKAKERLKAAQDRAGAFGVSAPPPMTYLYSLPPQGPLGTFGSVVPRPHAFCGDVYELKPHIPRLPDFREMDSIGSIYTPSLAVPNQLFITTEGIPGVTDRTVWFGIDYFATFWIRAPGEYEFMLTDGAILQIDDRRLIDLNGLHPAQTERARIQLTAGRHTIHVPYYEGTPNAVALTLRVRTAGEEWKIFDLRDFEPPAADPAPPSP